MIGFISTMQNLSALAMKSAKEASKKAKGAVKVSAASIAVSAALVFPVVFTTPVLAESEGFKFQEVPVVVTGSGCPPGTAFGIVNGDTVSIVFTGFDAKAGANKFDPKSCNVRIPLEVPSGYTVQPINIRYLGFANVPQTGRATMNVFAQFGGAGAWVNRDNFVGGFQSDFERNTSVNLGAVNACKTPVKSIFGLNTTLNAFGPKKGPEFTHIGINTIDLSTGKVVYQVKFGFYPCK